MLLVHVNLISLHPSRSYKSSMYWKLITSAHKKIPPAKPNYTQVFSAHITCFNKYLISKWKALDYKKQR